MKAMAGSTDEARPGSLKAMAGSTGQVWQLCYRTSLLHSGGRSTDSCISSQLQGRRPGVTHSCQKPRVGSCRKDAEGSAGSGCAQA